MWINKGDKYIKANKILSFTATVHKGPLFTINGISQRNYYATITFDMSEGLRIFFYYTHEDKKEYAKMLIELKEYL